MNILDNIITCDDLRIERAAAVKAGDVFTILYMLGGENIPVKNLRFVSQKKPTSVFTIIKRMVNIKILNIFRAITPGLFLNLTNILSYLHDTCIYLEYIF